MSIINFKKSILLLTALSLCFSCSKEKRSEIIKEEIKKDTGVISINNYNNNDIEHKYVINRRTSKVHSYSHGMSIVSDKYRLESNDDIEKILENENYDICLNCYAGLKLNLDKYKTSDKNNSNDEVDITNSEVNLIKQYMNMYEFGKCDTETQKFLICLFEVGSWYVNNVYTQLGGQLSAREVDDIAEAEASEFAYNKWRNYIDNYGKKYGFNENKKILPVVYDKGKPTDMVTYRCDLFKDAGYGKGDNIYSKSALQALKNSEGEEIDKEWKNYCVVDDSSKFAAAVYYHYINKEILNDKSLEERTAYGIDLWGTNSGDFLNYNQFVKKVLKTNKFDFYKWSQQLDDEYINEGEVINFKLRVGDAMCRGGHIEFYLGNNKVVSWGRVHKLYTINKTFTIEKDGVYSEDVLDKGIPYNVFIRLKGGD